ncbi:hypothetical protein [Streptomyces sp. NPDC086010]|uniref:hypothetical protein n=1 Tax=Streptomyces sp. NPDC086010 TaxID=3365745 RepID=UPI0037D79D59
MWGPLTEVPPLPEVVDLPEREAVMGQLEVRPSGNARLVSLVKEAIGIDRRADLLVSARPGPPACRMVRTALGWRAKQALVPG